MSLSLASRQQRQRACRDLDETTSREERAAILADCLLERLIHLTLRDQTDYLDALEREIAAALAQPESSPFGALFTAGAAEALASHKRLLMHIAVSDELLDSGIDEGLWRTALARLDGGTENAFDAAAAGRFLAICRAHGWTPAADLSLTI